MSEFPIIVRLLSSAILRASSEKVVSFTTSTPWINFFLIKSSCTGLSLAIPSDLCASQFGWFIKTKPCWAFASFIDEIALFLNSLFASFINTALTCPIGISRVISAPLITLNFSCPLANSLAIW